MVGFILFLVLMDLDEKRIEPKDVGARCAKL